MDRISVVAAIVIILASLGSPAWAEETKDTADVDAIGGTVTASVTETQRRSSSGGPASYTKAGPWTQVVYTHSCDRTGDGSYSDPPVAWGPGVDEYSGARGNSTCFPRPCATGAGDLFIYGAWTRPIGADGLATADFTYGGEQCVTEAEAARGGRPVITVDMVMDAAEALAPTPTFTMEPAAGSFVNIPNNYATTAQTVTVTVTVLGSPIPVEFTPTATTWAFGDSTTGTGVGIAGATVGQSGAVEHAYRHSGDYTITVATTYRARVTFPNGQVTTIDTPIVRTSAPQTLHVGEIQSIITDIG